MIQIMMEICEFFNTSDITCWIDCGNLLKLYRDNAINFDDIDLGFYLKDYDRVLDLISQNPEISIGRKWSKQLVVKYKNQHVDLFFCDSDEKYFYFPSYRTNPITRKFDLEWRLKYPKETYLPIKDYTFQNGLTFKTPNDIEKCLELHYGNWKIPVERDGWTYDLTLNRDLTYHPGLDYKRILFIGAHYDDIELSAGGTLSRFYNAGHEVWAVVTSFSDYSNYEGLQKRTIEEANKEGRDALNYLGVADSHIFNLQYPTKQVPFNNIIIEQLNKIIDDIQPDLIITHHLSDSHQDHINTAKSVLSAARYQKNIWMFEPIYPSKLSNIPARPIVYIDITKTMIYKIVSLEKHKTQIKKYPEWIDLVKAMGRMRGVEIQVEYAEAFEPIKIEWKI